MKTDNRQAPARDRAILRGKIAQRSARVHLEAIRLFHVWKRKSTDGNLQNHLKTLRRLDRLQTVERRLA